MTAPVVDPVPDPLPPETKLGYWVPVVHYLFAAILVAGAAAHSTFNISPALQAVCVLIASALVVIGTGVYTLHHYGLNKLALATFAAYLKSVVPVLLGDVADLKATVGPAAAPETVVVAPNPTATATMPLPFSPGGTAAPTP